MKAMLTEWWTVEDGTSTVEYAVILAFLLVVSLAALKLLGTSVATLLESLASRLAGG